MARMVLVTQMFLNYVIVDTKGLRCLCSLVLMPVFFLSLQASRRAAEWCQCPCCKESLCHSQQRIFSILWFQWADATKQ